jgi:hypothetical protein
LFQREQQKQKQKEKEILKMRKFERVNKALMEKTRETDNWVKVTRNVNASHKGKYALQNVVTNHIGSHSYKTLDEIIEEFELNI